MAASLHPSLENEARWAAREKADKLLAEAAKIASESGKKEGIHGGCQSNLEEEEEATPDFFPNNMSVIGSITIGTRTIFSKAAQANVDKGTLDLKRAMDIAIEADTAWENLVKQAEQT
jgi:hypothetical protein